MNDVERWDFTFPTGTLEPDGHWVMAKYYDKLELEVERLREDNLVWRRMVDELRQRYYSATGDRI